MSSGFKCGICGENHEGLPTDWAYKLPDEVWAINESEREEQARFTSDLCQFGERFFIRCMLEVPFAHSEGTFGWGAWAEVEWPVFERYLELYEHNGEAEPAHFGKLANALPAYPDSIGTPVAIQFRDASQRPSLTMRPADESLLAREQRAGIDEGRYHEILHVIGRN